MATNPNPRRDPSMTSRIAWVFLCMAMWFWAITGPPSVLFGALSLVVDVPFVDFGGGTNGEKPQYIRVAGILGAVDLSFVWLRCSGDLKFGDDTP